MDSEREVEGKKGQTQKNVRKNPHVLKNWTSYCEDIGIDRSTANKWLKEWFEENNKPKNPSGNARV